ncbi:AMP-binding protein [Nakamurella sp. PAMC28650]|uniref:AMP-binding protein n=1 Tax=Nakamurella sp. PAMC28650 TaxID=2762325 RepID=UPI00164DCE0C|nr:AMP-binding protein [Nakamurella sp. PAMC28650]QNK82140.1 AMP-binding protein [Nakamurella sp. PAMC28650]
MSLIEYLGKGASLGVSAPCLTTGDSTLSYGDAQVMAFKVARALANSGVRPGEKVAILSVNDPIAFSCVFGISRAGAVWCPINLRNEAAENRDLLEFFDCACLIFQGRFSGLVEQIAAGLPAVKTLVCVDGPTPVGVTLDEWLVGVSGEPLSVAPLDDTMLIVGTGGTTGRPKGVVLTGRNVETMSPITLMSCPFAPRPVYLALAPLTHAAGVLCFPIMAMGGEIVILRTPDLSDFLAAVQTRKVTHTFLPPTLIYMLLSHHDLPDTDLSSLQCFWYGAAPMSAARLEEAMTRIGPVMAQLFGQSEAPMMISTMAPADHFDPDGSVAVRRLSSAGRPAPLVTVAIMDESGGLPAAGERGEIVIRSSLVMAGYYKNPEATAEVGKFGWHYTGGFNVYSAEVEQALMQHPDIADCAVIGLPDDKWGERVTAVLQLRPGAAVTSDEVRAFVKARVGSVKSPKQVEFWADLPRSKVGKVLKKDIKAQILGG